VAAGITGYRAKIRRKADEIHARRFTLDWISATVDDLFDARDLPSLGGLKSDFDANPSE
jgi:hypothetical protein